MSSGTRSCCARRAWCSRYRSRFCFGLSWLAGLAGLAPIVGAFAAGLVLEDVHFEDHLKRGEYPLHESLHALSSLLVPVFFVYGLVRPRRFARLSDVSTSRADVSGRVMWPAVSDIGVRRARSSSTGLCAS